MQWISRLPGCKAVFDKFHGSGRQSKFNCLQDQANFHRSWAWQNFNWDTSFCSLSLNKTADILQATCSNAFFLMISLILTQILLKLIMEGLIVNKASLGPVSLTLLQHVARILANGSAAFFESCDAIGWNSCDVSQKTLVIQGPGSSNSLSPDRESAITVKCW